MSGRRCLLRVGCRRESSLLPIWRWGGRDLALLQSSETSDGKANRCGCVWKKKKCHKLLLSYLTSNDLSQLQLLQIQKIFPKKKKKKNGGNPKQKTLRFCLSSRNILHLLEKTSKLSSENSDYRTKGLMDMNGFFDKQHYMFLFWKQWCLPY